MNKIYKEMYPNKLFTLEEAKKIIKNYQVCRNNINRLAKSKQIIKLKSGIYFIKPLDNQDFYPNPIHIGSKLRQEGVICANSALKIYGLTSKEDSTIYIGAQTPSKIRIDKNTYRIVKNKDFGIDKIQYAFGYATITLKITDLEKTLLDCIRTKSTRSEELITILRTKPIQINMKKILTYLEKYNMPILYSKTGLILSACKQNIKIEDSELEKIRSKLTKKIYYYKEKDLKLIRPKYIYNKEWNIMIPQHLFDLIKPIQIQPIQQI